MKRILLYSLIVAVSLVVSCVSYRLDPIQNERITIKHDRGRGIPLYQDETVGMIITPEFRDSEVMIKITIKNCSNSSFTISDKDFNVENSEDKIEWKSLKVYTSKEYYKKECLQHNAGLFLLGVTAALDTATAGYGSSSTSGYYTGSTAYGSYSGTYSSTTSYYDPTAAQLAAQRNSQMLSDYSKSGQGWQNILEDCLFYQKTLTPGEEYFGLVSQVGFGNYYRICCNNTNFSIIEVEYIKVAY